MTIQENDISSVCVTFDKLDKIGVSGVKNELEDKEFDSIRQGYYTGTEAFSFGKLCKPNMM